MHLLFGVCCLDIRMETVASKVPFYQFAQLLDKISAQSGAERKKRHLQEFINEWRAFHNVLHGSTTTVRFMFLVWVPFLELYLKAFSLFYSLAAVSFIMLVYDCDFRWTPSFLP